MGGFPSDPMMGDENAKQVNRLETEHFEASGKNELAVELERGNMRINVTRKPRTHTSEE